MSAEPRTFAENGAQSVLKLVFGALCAAAGSLALWVSWDASKIGWSALFISDAGICLLVAGLYLLFYRETLIVSPERRCVELTGRVAGVAVKRQNWPFHEISRIRISLTTKKVAAGLILSNSDIELVFRAFDECRLIDTREGTSEGEISPEFRAAAQELAETIGVPLETCEQPPA